MSESSRPLKEDFFSSLPLDNEMGKALLTICKNKRCCLFFLGVSRACPRGPSTFYTESKTTIESILLLDLRIFGSWSLVVLLEEGLLMFT